MFMGFHNHTCLSNTRGFLDSTIKVEDLIKYAKECGHNGVAFTEHDTIASHLMAENAIVKLRKEDPEKWNDFKIALGNEIYLCDRKKIQEEGVYEFPHFILIAKDEIGHKQIRELSTRAWVTNSFTWVNVRTPTFYDDLFEIVEKNRGHLIASTACIGSQPARLVIQAYEENPDSPDYSGVKKWLKRINECFGEGNFFLELQPSKQKIQEIVNKAYLNFSKELGIDYILTSDSHYLKASDRTIHEAFLKSNEDSGRQREVGEFYATTYVMSEKEFHEYLDNSLGYEVVQKGIENTQILRSMIKEYSLKSPLEIPYEPDDLTEPDKSLIKKYSKEIPLLPYFANSETDSDRHLAREIVRKIEKEPEEFNNKDAFNEIQECLNSIKLSSEANHAHWSAYLLMVRQLIDVAWDCGSLVGCSRGSGGGFYLLHVLGIVQFSKIREEKEEGVHMKGYRFLNPKRVSVLDVDVDIQNEYRPAIIKALQKKYCGEDEEAGVRKVMKVQTLSTVKSKSAIQIACRGLGYTSEEGQFLASFIEADRGQLRTLYQTFYGDEDNNIHANSEFVNLMVHQYPDVWEVAQSIEGLVSGVGSHAGGLVIAATTINDHCALMKTASGDIITQLDLHQLEDCSLIKIDLLAVDALGKIKSCLELLLEDNKISWQGSWRDTYEKYVGMYNIERKSPELWKLINEGKIYSLFQMEKQSGKQAIAIGHPVCLKDLATLNSVMRLMASSPGAESPLERYGRFKKKPELWDKEMKNFGLTPHEMQVIKKYAESGVISNQEPMMESVQDPELGGFDLLWADRLRKAVSKKKVKDYEQLKNEYYANVKEKHLSFKVCDYLWSVLIQMQRGYGFNLAHTAAYSLIGLQEANLVLRYHPSYWNCANLISDSGGEDSTVKYGKISRAISSIQKEGVVVALPDVNRVKFDFHPDVKQNEIIYGLKPIQGVGAQVAKAIVANQPYTSMEDFYQKMQVWKSSSPENKFGDATMISLIKAGCFDVLENKPREEIMKNFINSHLVSPLTSLKMANIEDLNAIGLLTESQVKYELRLFRYRKYIFQDKFLHEKAGKSPSTFFYKLDRKFAEPFFYEHFETYMQENKDYKYTDDGFVAVKRGAIDKVFDKLTEEFRTKVLTNQEFLDKLNQTRFEEEWQNKAKGNISSWEMDSMCMYYHPHELAHVNREAYSIANFDDLPEEPEIADYYFYRNQEKPRFKLCRIVGTVIDKNAMKSTVTLLTPDGVVDVRFYKGQFSFYDRQIAQVNEDGTKTVLEKSWFRRGTKLMITGFRRGEVFVPRKYSDSIYKHTAQKIEGIDDKGLLTLISERVDADELQ